MLERAMGRGAVSLTATMDRAGVVFVVGYGDGRRGVVELTTDSYVYGGTLRGDGKAAAFVVDMSLAYSLQLGRIEAFFRTGRAPVALDDAVEVMAMLDAAQRSFDTGTSVPVGA